MTKAKESTKKTTAVATKDESAVVNPTGAKQGLSAYFADKVGVTQDQFISTVKATCFKGKQVSNEVMVMFLAVAREYGLNPFLGQIEAFEKDGGVKIIVPIDGWTSVVNSQPQHDGFKCTDNFDSDGNLESCTTELYHKDRAHPSVITERLDECKKDTGPWNKWPARMLRHKSFIQCARYAYSLTNVIDRDEAERIEEADVVSTNSPQATAATAKNTQQLRDKIAEAKSGTSESEAEIVEAEDGGYPADAMREDKAKDAVETEAAEAKTEVEEVKPEAEIEKSASVGEAKDVLTEYLRGAKEGGFIKEADYIEACEQAAQKDNLNLEYMTTQLAGWKNIVAEKKNAQGDLGLS